MGRMLSVVVRGSLHHTAAHVAQVFQPDIIVPLRLGAFARGLVFLANKLTLPATHMRHGRKSESFGTGPKKVGPACR